MPSGDTIRNLMRALETAKDRRTAARATPGDPAPDPARVEDLVLRAGIVLTIAAVIFQTVAHMTDLLAFDLRYGSLDADADLAPFAFASASATLFCGACSLLIAATWPKRAIPLILLGFALAYLAVDDMFAIHERISSMLDFDLFGVDDMGRALWPLVYLPLIGACFVVLWFVGGSLGPRPRRVLLTGLLLLAFAIGLEMGSLGLVNIGIESPDLTYEIEVVIEEGAELAGWMLIGVALASTVLRGGPAVRR